MAMKSIVRNTLFLAVLLPILIGICIGGQGAFGQVNPLIGTWRSSGRTGPLGAGITYTYHVTFRPDGTYQNRLDVGGEGGRGGGTTIIQGQYSMTSPNSYAYREISAVQCPIGVGCYPARQLPPDFGTPKPVQFEMMGPNQVLVNGNTYYRVPTGSLE
jgi:hypothetical protein